MDPVTHTLAGVTLGNALFRNRFGPKAPIILAIASNLPDLDIVAHLTFSREAVLLRRTFGHSLILLPLWALGLAWLLRRTYARGQGLGPLFGMCLLGALVHLFLDLANSFGVVPLWPVSDWRPELAIVFILDLALTGLLAAPLILWALRLRRRFAAWSQGALALAAAYLMLCGSARSMALVQLSEESARLGVRPDFLYVFPEPLGPHRWRGVLRAGGIYRLYLMRPFSGELEARGEAETLPNDPRVLRVRETRLGRRLDWFFKAPVWTASSLSADPQAPWEVTVRDLRFTSLVMDFHHAPFLFRFRVEPGGTVEPL